MLKIIIIIVMSICVYITGLIENKLVWAKWHQSASSTFGLIEITQESTQKIGLNENSLVWSKWHQRAPSKFGLNKNSLVWSKWHQRAPNKFGLNENS